MKLSRVLHPKLSERGRRLGRPPKPRVIEYRRAKLYKKQEDALFAPQRYVVIEAATKTGKTTGALVWLTEMACLHGGDGKHAWWVAPSYKQAAIAWKRIQRYLPEGCFYAKGDLTVTLINGTVISFLTGEKPDNLYGEDVIAVVLDEATRLREAAWHAVRSTLTATGGPARLIGNVKGRRNFVHKLGVLAKQYPDGNIAHFTITAWDAVDAGVMPREEIEDARRMLPTEVFNELYLAIPTEDGSNPFGLDSLLKVRQPVLSKKPVVSWGIDLAKHVDFTEMVGLDEDRMMARYERFQKPWRETIPHIRRVVGRTAALIDSTGVGDPIVELLAEGNMTGFPTPQRPDMQHNALQLPTPYRQTAEVEVMQKEIERLTQSCPNIHGFVFSNTSKQQLMEMTAVTIQHGECGIWPGPNDVLMSQFESFEYEYSPTKRIVRYAAADGARDDGVMAFALALKGFTNAARSTAVGGSLATF